MLKLVQVLLPAIAYGALKYIAYALWCRLGIWLLARKNPHPWKAALLFGALRLGIGIALGIFISVASAMVGRALHSDSLGYFLVFVPVRVFEWSLLHILISPTRRGRSSILWVAGGIVVSFVADIPFILAMNGPSYRFC